MSKLTRFLGKTKEEDTPDKKITIIPDIDAVCEKGGVDVGSFSVIGMKRATKKMQGSLDDFDRETFFREFFNFYQLATAPDKRARGCFHPSSLNSDCPRKLTYELSGVPFSDEITKKVSGSLQRIFDLGSWLHLYVQNILFSLNMLKGAEVPIVNKKRYINGKADGVIDASVFGEEVLLEIKSMNSFIYRKAIFTPFDHHEYQASLYASELGLKKVLYVYFNKDTSEMKDFLRPVRDDLVADANKKIDLVIGHVEKGTLPKRQCTGRLSETALKCPYCTRCFEDK